MGFPKKLGQIYVTKFHELNPAVGAKRAGARMKGICESFDSLNMVIDLELIEKIDVDPISVSGMCVLRHFPSFEDRNRPLVYDLTELICENQQKKEIWRANATVQIDLSKHEEITQLQPRKIVAAHCSRDGFKLLGVKVLHSYLQDEGQ